MILHCFNSLLSLFIFLINIIINKIKFFLYIFNLTANQIHAYVYTYVDTLAMIYNVPYLNKEE